MFKIACKLGSAVLAGSLQWPQCYIHGRPYSANPRSSS
jgi:hypothetical protein